MNNERMFILRDTNGENIIRIKVHSQNEVKLLRLLLDVNYLDFEEVEDDGVYDVNDY